MHYIIALGNPGSQYEKTRHNLGWRVADGLVKEAGLDASRNTPRYLGHLTEGVWEGERLSVLYPDTFMNKSGEAAALLVPGDKRSGMIVLHDEVALPLGTIRISVGSSAGGHNGVRSIIESCGTSDFTRVRLGVGAAPAGIPLERYVLDRFLPEEEPVVQVLVTEAVAAIKMIVTKGATEAMNMYNKSK